jgi:excisionase family DNA binding protein
MVDDPITVSIPEAGKRSGLGRTSLYELIRQSRIQTVKIGRRRLVVFESLRSLLLAGGDA